jgi:hypothetical protein
MIAIVCCIIELEADGVGQHGVPRAAGTAVRTEDQRQEELQKIDKYLKLVDQVDTKVRSTLDYPRHD